MTPASPGRTRSRPKSLTRHRARSRPRALTDAGAAPTAAGKNTFDRPGPDAELAARRYRTLADDYDELTAWGSPYRKLAVDALELARGEVVVDVGCGTGLNFPAIEHRISTPGRLVGVEPCAAMLGRAAERVQQAGWGNVELVSAAAQNARLPRQADAVLFCATHDVLRSRHALANILRQVETGTRVVAAGPKWAPWWHPTAAVNFYTWWANAPYVTSFEGFEHPWSHLDHLMPDLEVEQDPFGAYYVARGTVRAHPAGVG